MKDKDRASRTRAGNRERRLQHRGSIVAVAAAITIAAAACSALPGSPSGSVKYQEALAFAKCMRAHGVPNFPDPDSNGQFSGNGIDRNSPQVQSAGNACRSLLPGQNPAAQVAQAGTTALRFSRCMRAHGVPNFPDPSVQSNGGGVTVTIRMKAGAGGIDPHSPQFKAAQQACSSILPKPGSHHSGSGG
ncbi:MAG TPA: hypothetical protein VIX86_04540 [Streptosporangiaceae bacterium]